jgi:GH15 family glucan-1,4-alpha-glucosidase
VVLEGLTNARTGAVTAAATTSLPESVGGTRNWDYRYAWIRDSQFSVRSLAELGFEAEADRFRRFVERSTGGSADAIQVLYGLGGERRISEVRLDHLEGYRCSTPVRVGNAASTQLQLDVYGYLLDLAWRWHQRGHSPDDDYWRFLKGLVDAVTRLWDQPDRGIWESRGEPQHYVHSKVMCWAALERGIRLAHECERQAPIERWQTCRDEVRRAIESKGYDQRRGIFVRAFGDTALDAALLLLPSCDFLPYDDPRMVRTADAICEHLDEDGLLRRYRGDDGLDGEDAPFVACTFWLVECLAHQGRVVEARAAFARAIATANDLGLFSEEYDPADHALLGNFPQALTHLAHISAALALQSSQDPTP